MFRRLQRFCEDCRNAGGTGVSAAAPGNVPLTVHSIELAVLGRQARLLQSHDAKALL